MNRLINKLLSNFEIEDIEKSLVQFFVERNGTKVEHNKLILEILGCKSRSISELKELLSKAFDQFDINNLEKSFELLIPVEDRKINGAFFTPPVITDFIATELITDQKHKICDPSCGCGAFFIAAIKVFRAKWNKPVIDIIENNLYGVDLLDYSVRRCKIILTLFALLCGEDKEEIAFNIYKKDSLNIDWREEFPEVMRNGGFDVIIGNPPYVKYQDLPDEIREELYNKWTTLKTGAYNLYFAFFELGMSLLKKTGKLGYITPNNYFTSLAGIHLREFLHFNRYIKKIIDFNHIKIFDAQTYTCITFLSHTKNAFFLFERIEEKKKLGKLKRIKFSMVRYDALDNKKWRLLREIDQENIRKIESIGIPLSALVDIKVGIATCKDVIYFVDGTTLKNGYYRKKLDGKEYLIEKEITKPIAKISDFQTQIDLDRNKRRIIFPYYIENNKAYLIKKNELKKQYPKAYEYLSAAKQKLEDRDKGKVKYDEWYAYARTQGLTLRGKKLLTPTFSHSPRFLLDKNEDELFCNGYGIFLKKEESILNNFLTLEILKKILNSRVMEYYVRQTSVSIEGGYSCYQKNFIERFTIPNLNQKEVDYLKYEKRPSNIDNFLIKKYGVDI